MSGQSSGPILVVGAGITGVSAALEAAELDGDVILIERQPFVGGRVAQLYKYFPKLCPPSCGMEINVQRLERSPRIRIMLETQITAARATDSGLSVTVERAPGYVNDRCTACGECAKACPVSISDPFNLGMKEVSAVREPHAGAWPPRFVLERSACPEGCAKCVDACAYDAIDLSAEEVEETLEVAAAVVATGWRPYALDKLSDLGGGVHQDVISNVQMERLASPTGPTGGRILRPANGQPPKEVAFVQCAGSRDVNHLPYCSGVCCLASLKQAMYVKEQLPETRVKVFYIDLRTPGRNEDVLVRAAALENVEFVKGKVGRVDKNQEGALVLRVEDVDAGQVRESVADLVVLATGMVPNAARDELALDLHLQQDDDGFGLDPQDKGAKVFVAGVARRPEDVAASVRDATAAAAKAMTAARGRA